MAQYDGEIRIDTHIDPAGFNKGVQNISGSLGGLKSTLGKIAGLVGAAFAVRSLVNFGKEAIGLASDLQEVENVVSTAFGNMAGQVDEWAESSIRQFGMSELTAKRTASTYMAMSNGMGVMGQAAADMAMHVAGLAADMASFYNVEQDVASTALQSIWTGETETLKRYGLVMTQANLNAYALKNGYTKLIGEMSQAEQVQLRYAYVTDALSLAAGDFAKTSDSWANQTRILSEQWKQLMSILGSGLMQVLTPALQALNDFLAHLIRWANAIGKVLSAVFGIEAKEISATSAELNAGIGDAVDGENELADAAAAANKELRQQMGFDEMNVLAEKPAASGGGGGGGSGVLGDLGNLSIENKTQETDSSVDKLQTKLQGLLDWYSTAFAPSLNAWGEAWAVVAPAAEDAGSRISTAWDTLWQEHIAPFGTYFTTEFVPDIANTVSETFAPIFADTMPVLLEEFALDFENACLAAGAALDDLTLAMQNCQQAFTEMMETISLEWDEHGGALLENFTQFKESLREIWDYIYKQIIKPVMDNIGEKIDWLWNTSLKPLWDNIVGFLFSVGENLGLLWNNAIAPFLMWLTDTFGPAISTVINFVVDVFFVLFSVVADVIGGILKALDGLIQFVTGVFTGDWELAWGGVAKIFGGIWDAIWGVIRGVINLVITAINLVIGAIYSLIAAVVNGVGGIAKAIGNLVGQNWGWPSMPSITPKIPLLAQGAVLPANKPFLAVVGDQKNGTNIEAPLDTIKQALAEVLQDTGRGSDRPLQIVIKVGSDTLGVAAVKSINELTRQTGRCELQLA